MLNDMRRNEVPVAVTGDANLNIARKIFEVWFEVFLLKVLRNVADVEADHSFILHFLIV